MFFWMSLFSCLFAMVFTPIASWIGWRIGALDIPTDWRRMHRDAVPRSGGFAILLAFVISCLAAREHSIFLQFAFLGGGLFFLLGLLDDIFSMGALGKMMFQIPITVLSLMWSGMANGKNLFFASFWILLLVNAHNFVDGLDGLFAGTAALEGGALCVCFLILEQPFYALPPLLLSAACLGFRHFNRYPARIFAGDCGSQSVGFLLGYLSVPLLFSVPNGIGAFSPLFLFAYPLTDLFTAVLRRFLRGKSPFAADRAHLHHRICDAGVSHARCSDLLHLICAAMAVIGVLLCNGQSLLFAGIACLLTAFLLVRLRFFIVNFA